MRRPAMKQFNLLLPKALFFRVREHCRPRGLSVAAFCREAIQEKADALPISVDPQPGKDILEHGNETK
jgi:hypothetical protein